MSLSWRRTLRIKILLLLIMSSSRFLFSQVEDSLKGSLTNGVKNDIGVLFTGGSSNAFIIWRHFYNNRELMKFHTEVGTGFGRPSRSENYALQFQTAMGAGVGSTTHIYLKVGLFHHFNFNSRFDSIDVIEDRYSTDIEIPDSVTLPYDFDSFCLIGIRQRVFKTFYLGFSIGNEWAKVRYPLDIEYYTFNLQLGYGLPK